MAVRLLVFGALTEVTGTSSFEFEVEAPCAIDGLRARLTARWPGLADRPFRMAVNHEFASDEVAVADGDEVALLPPFAGG